jgi:hypothetical protein
MCLVSPAHARRRTFGGGSNYVSNGHFGAGLELGGPSGLNAKLFLTPSTALDFGLGWFYDNYYRDGSGLHLYVDHLWHPSSLTDQPAFKLPWYIGVGANFWSFDDRDDKNNDRYGAIGVRVPIGIAFDFNDIPLDAFVELTPTFDIFYGGYRDHAGLLLEASIGARFWFD